MAAPSSPLLSPAVDTDDDTTGIPDSQAQSHDDVDISQGPEASRKDGPGPDSAPQPAQAQEGHPLQKRRRVTRACDECRRKKIKCNGKQPCTHCTVYSYECTYDQPSNRRRNPAPQYVEAVESRLHRAEALLRIVLPDVNLDDPQFDVHAMEQMPAAMRLNNKKQLPPRPASASAAVTSASQPDAGAADAGEESLLETMVDNSGCLDLDDRGHWDYHGHSSGLIFIRRLRKQLGTSDLTANLPKLRPVSQMLDSPKSSSDSPQESTLPAHDLPPRAVAKKLCHNALDDGCALMRIVHAPSFYAMMDRVYNTPPEQFTNEENTFLPLLYVVIAVGCLFSDDGASTLDVAGYEGAIGQGFQYFRAGRQLLDITDCRDLTSLQAICFMVLFLQSSARLSTCYSYIGVALRSALRLGLHRSVAANFNPIERELRKRIFWVIRRMDVYVSVMLGLPQMLSDDDVDQEYPFDIDDEFITADGLLPMPSDRTSLMAGANAHTRLTNITLKVVKYIYPVKNVKYRSQSDQRYMVSHSKIREIERDLQAWMEELPAALRPGMEVSPQLERIRQLLRISYAHVQMVMYRPFLHYVSSGSQARGVDKRSYACAAACVSVSRNIVHITTGMHRRGLLNGSFWFTMYTTYFAILSLIFFVLENPDSPTAKDGVLKDAMEGKNTLAGLAKRSLAADRCSQSLSVLFKSLPELLKKRQSSSIPINLKRAAPANRTHVVKLPQRAPAAGANTFPLHPDTDNSAEEPKQPSTNVDDTHVLRESPQRNIGAPELPLSVASASSERFLADHASSPRSGMFDGPQLGQAPSTLTIAQHYGHLPDLMPIMFPSGDPFAYPTQPMSTLEDGHFREDPGPGSVAFSFDPRLTQPQRPAVPSTVPAESSNVPLGNASMAYTAFPNVPMFPTASSASLNGTIPAHMQHSMHSGLQSPISPSTALSHDEPVGSPDLVSIPNQNFDWQSMNFQPGSMPADQGTANPVGLENSQSLGMEVDENAPFGMAMDLGIPLDDVFGNHAFRNSDGGPANDGFFQWGDG